MRALYIPFVATAALLSMAAIPPSESGRAAFARFQGLDRDHDGRLGWPELNARGHQYAADSLFLLLDADGDGRLTLHEVEGKIGGGRVARFDAYDADKNGVVVRREFPAFADRRLFDALDRDRDGGLALSEMRPAFAGAHARREPEEQAGPHPAPPQRQPPCWVPTPRDGRVEMEFPVTNENCRPR